jgi:hypothetical protein
MRSIKYTVNQLFLLQNLIDLITKRDFITSFISCSFIWSIAGLRQTVGGLASLLSSTHAQDNNNNNKAR